ncbi:MAG: ABC transporter permease subunit [Pseudomonadales bacterium]|nr:ABC transporter permease subunit [Pseudomonadales bacterium]
MSLSIHPLTLKKLQRFRRIKRGYYSAVFLMILLVAGCFAELLVSNRAIVVKYNDTYYFPTYSHFLPGETFGLDYPYETNYRELANKFSQLDGSNNWLLMPPVPFNAFETDLKEGTYPPYPPSLQTQHYLGTDSTGRDILARLVYGFRIAIWFSIMLLLCNYLIGVVIGCIMGYFSGKFDIVFQRVIEIWSNIPYLYVIMIIASIMVPGFWSLLSIMIFFGWMGMTWYMRTSTYKEKARTYTLAARALGASHWRIIYHHILPNSVSILITFIPFSVAAGITALTALDYLGFGLPPPTPSWGELLKQGTDNLDSPWIVGSVVSAMTIILVMVTWIGEAIREAFDPKKFTVYE